MYGTNRIFDLYIYRKLFLMILSSCQFIIQLKQLRRDLYVCSNKFE